MKNTKGWNPTDLYLPDNDDYVFVMFKIRHPHSDDYTEISVGIGEYGTNFGKEKCWRIVEDQVHEYPANYWEGEFKVLMWMPVPEIPSSFSHSE